jgi:glutaminase
MSAPPQFANASVAADGEPDELHGIPQACFEQARADDSGRVADYIPELAKANPDHFGLAIWGAT